MDLSLVINGLSLDCKTVAEAETLIATLVLGKVSINLNGKEVVPKVSIETAD